MIDPAPTPGSDEELSAAADGELDPDRLASIEADPALRARRDDLARAGARVAGPVEPLDAVTIDDLVGTALKAVDRPAAGQRSRGPHPWLVAAAVTLLVAIGLGLVWSGRDDGSADLASTSDASSLAREESDVPEESATQDQDGESGNNEAENAPALSDQGNAADAASTTAPGPDAALVPVPLGDFATKDDLRRAAARAFVPVASDTTSSPTPTPEQVQRCATQLQVTLELDDQAQQAGYARVADDQVLVYEFPATSYADDSPTTLVAAVGLDACQEVVIFER